MMRKLNTIELKHISGGIEDTVAKEIHLSGQGISPICIAKMTKALLKEVKGFWADWDFGVECQNQINKNLDNLHFNITIKS